MMTEISLFYYFIFISLVSAVVPLGITVGFILEWIRTK